MSSATEHKWNRIYQARVNEAQPAAVLTQNKHLLPNHGTALDLACGLGSNALLLAEQGLTVKAWDIAETAISKLKATALTKGLAVDAAQRDLITRPPLPGTFDVIVVSFFLHRPLCLAIEAALKPQGLLFYQTWCQQKVSDSGPSNPDYLLADNELLTLFPTLKLRVYCEESLRGDQQQGLRNQALLVAEKLN